MTNAALVDALHRAIRELEKVGEHSSIVKGVIANLQEVIDRTLEGEQPLGKSRITQAEWAQILDSTEHLKNRRS